MKHLITFTFLFFTTVTALQAQKFKGLDKSPLDLIEYPGNRGESQWARILYSRPQLNGRSIESLVPEGKVWRMGANESTELTLTVPMKVGGTSLAAGTYTMYSLPYEGEMTIIINKATHVWGAYSYSQDMDVARVTVPMTEGNESLEAFSMIFEKVEDDAMDLHMGWGYYRATLRFTK
ncbi:DUF2911 domain-containing protein [Flavobacteriaceae bacterium]|nr:DUF2911 domain-containing protein [Flavobacteriaceae bacterium]MDA8948070.1 DUF2911 domain-containing protein [Flavobacteriaceae bacterium]MDC3354160.1 DUF2911 domain-containing protein [Flavobacteriaceae bacterium]